MLLAIDTSAQLCAVCLFDMDSGQPILEDSRDIGRGHAEILMPQIGACLEAADATFKDVQRIGVVNGPGSFTGLRVGLAAARGLRLALGVETIGISSLQALEAEAGMNEHDGRLLTLIDARRGQAYCKLSGENAPFIETFEQLAHNLPTEIGALCGSGATQLKDCADTQLPIIHEKSAPSIVTVADLAAKAPKTNAPPEPLYLRSADAKPQTGFVLEFA